MTATYLPIEAVHLITRIYGQHPWLTLVGSLLVWGGLTTIVRQKFHRGGMDLGVFAMVVMITLLFISACLYLLATHPGYHFL